MNDKQFLIVIDVLTKNIDELRHYLKGYKINLKRLMDRIEYLTSENIELEEEIQVLNNKIEQLKSSEDI